jgi:hypothetical protein
MKNVHLIPTDKPSRLVIDTIENKLYLQPILHEKTLNVIPQHIYITSDEEIKEGDWVYYENGHLKGIHKVVNGQRPKTMILKKIILTTDQELINNGVQAIDDEFLEWFVKNPSCENVEVEKRGGNYLGSKCLKCGYIENHDEVDTNRCPKCSNATYEHLYENKIIIPQEEPKTNLEKLPFPELVEELANYYKEVPLVEESKQETTLEEAADIDSKNHYKDQSDYWAIGFDSFKRGAKWQQERSQTVVPFDATEIEVFAIKPDDTKVLKAFAFIGYKVPNGNFMYSSVPFTEEPRWKKTYSEEEVKELIEKLVKDCYYMQEPNQDVAKWFEQFKKK